MKFTVLKSFTWSGRSLTPGESIDIPEGHAHIRSLTRSKFIRQSGSAGTVKVQPAEALVVTSKKLPSASKVVEEIKNESPGAARRDPKAVVAEAKAKANAAGRQ